MKTKDRANKPKHTVREEPPEYQDGAIVLYQTPDGSMSLDVRLEKETLWMDAHQMARLFGRDRSVILRHIRNIYETNELDQTATCAKNAQVAADGKLRQMDLYNLDVIIGVGYRVNSLRGTQFRIWATQVLRDHLVKGYSVNAKRLKELRQSLKLIGQVLERYDVTSDQARALLHVVTDYASALDLLDDYDHQRVSIPPLEAGEARGIDHDEARAVIGELRRKFGGSDLFGREKDQSLAGSLGAVMQSFGGSDLYPSRQEKAAHLLYFLVKNHPFVDGNKRIAAALFLWFMEKNGILYRADGTRHIADNALVAITLMIAESDPQQKDILTKMVVNLIKDGK
jgi:prophage maintenance system killer protein